MKTLMTFLQNKVVPTANKFQQIPFIMVLRNSMLSIMPLMIVGAIGTFLINMPFPSINNFLQPIHPFLQSLTTVTSNISGIIVSIVVGYYSAKQFKLDEISGIVISVSSFMAATLTEELTISVEIFGATGLFSAIFIGFLSVYILYLTKKYNIQINMPESVPAMVSTSFSLILSLVLSVSIFLFFRVILNIDINTVINLIFSPLSKSLDTLPGLLALSFMMSLFFIIGINPIVFISMLIPILTINGELNAALALAGEQPTQLVTWGMETIMCAGGTGATLGLAILLLRSKSSVYKTLGKMAIVPSLFNINEPVVYGVPIVFNPMFIVPFILAPLVNITLTWFMMDLNLITRAFVDIPFTTPQIINGYLMSGGSITTAIWTGFLVIVSIAIYYPFFKVSEREQLKQEVSEGVN